MAVSKKEKLSVDKELKKAIVKNENTKYSLPDNWVWTHIEDIADVVTGGTPSKSNKSYYGGKFPFIKPADLDQGRKLIYASECLSEEGREVSRVLPAGSTSVCCIGTIGKCGYLEMEATTNQQINSIVPKHVNSLYVYYYCCTNDFITSLNALASATTISIVNKSKMSGIAIPLPPLAEQQRIVERIESLFEKLDAAKELAQNALDSFENRKAAILHKAFTGELTAKWREENGVSWESWKKMHLGNLTQIIGGGTPKTNILEYYENGEISWITPADLSNYNNIYIKKGRKNITKLGLEKSSAKLLPKGTVLLSSRAPIGYVAISKNELATNQGFKNFLPNDKYVPEFLYYYLKFMGKKLEDYASGTTFLELSAKRTAEIPITIPSIEEQTQIIDILSSVIENEQRAKDICNVIEKIDLMKKAILARAFRGELGTNNPEEESAIELLKEVLKEKL